MDLPRAGQEYAYVTVANEPDPADVVEASTDSGLTWVPVTVTGTEAEILLRGPDYRDDERGLLIPVNATKLWVRVKSDPQAIPRIAAVVILY
jgi:hypothetical protein